MTTTTIEHGKFKDLACAWLSNGQVKLAVTTGCGPRVVFWGWAGESAANLMAEVPEFVVRGFYFLGGHRLWAAPESFERTYRPDDAPPILEAKPGGALFTTLPDRDGLVKEIELALPEADAPWVTVSHVLRNTGREPLELAPWALSMLRLGGVMILPQPLGPSDADGLLPNRRLILWPYSRIADRRLHLGDRLSLIQAEAGPANKLGYLSQHGWLAYWLDGTLFSTRFDPRPAAAYPDLGCNVECYFDHRFIELETLGPLVRLEPGQQTRHVETWQLDRAARPATEAEAESLAHLAGLPGF